jgi:hypothetical protein
MRPSLDFEVASEGDRRSSGRRLAVWLLACLMILFAGPSSSALALGGSDPGAWQADHQLAVLARGAQAGASETRPAASEDKPFGLAPAVWQGEASSSVVGTPPEKAGLRLAWQGVFCPRGPPPA